jgi:anti-sigma regulatory factor (Ser/Thr protein kinase)
MSGTADVEKSPILDMMFDSGTLHLVRADVQARAIRAGFPDPRVEDMVLAVHELAANAVHHGAGAGRLRIWNVAGSLHAQVDDGALASGDPAAPAGHEDGAVGSWLATPGHGLWVVQQVADQLQVMSSAQGTRATVTFSPSAEASR